MKAVTAALRKKAVSNAEGRSFSRVFFNRLQLLSTAKNFLPGNKVFLASMRVLGGAVENQLVSTGKITAKVKTLHSLISKQTQEC